MLHQPLTFEKQAIRAIFFDQDGVLIDSEGVNVHAVYQAFRESGYPLAPDDRDVVIARHIKDTLPFFAKKYAIPAERQLTIINSSGSLYYQLFTDGIRAISGADKELHALSAHGYRLALATSSDRAAVNIVLQKFGWEHLFEVILSCEDVRERKPSPEIYRNLQQKMGLSTNEIVVIEDSAVGVIAARTAGLACIAIPNEYTRHQDFSQASLVLPSLQELTTVLDI